MPTHPFGEGEFFAKHWNSFAPSAPSAVQLLFSRGLILLKRLVSSGIALLLVATILGAILNCGCPGRDPAKEGQGE
jgi:hypothetical protein